MSMLKNPCWRRRSVVNRQKAVCVINPSDHLGLVRHVVGKFIRNRKTPIEDTEEYSDGLYGLMRATRSYRSDHGTKFSTYAYYCIQNWIIRGYHDRRREQERRLRIYEEYSVDDEFDNVAQFEAEEEVATLVNLALDNYPIREERDRINRQVAIDYYLKGMKLQDIADSLLGGVTRERVRQRRNEALIKMRDWLLDESDRAKELARELAG